jgi:hypothetical protein
MVAVTIVTTSTMAIVIVTIVIMAITAVATTWDCQTASSHIRPLFVWLLSHSVILSFCQPLLTVVSIANQEKTAVTETP